MLLGKKKYLILLIALTVSSIIVIYNPNKFQKLNTIRCIDKYNHPRTLESVQKLDLEEFIHKIPYKNVSNYVYSVNPEIKYQKTIINGYGDCSTMSYGAAYYLLKNNIKFELIHFLPTDSLFSGGGHVALRVPYLYKKQFKIGILDLAGGGVPESEGKQLDINDIEVNELSVQLNRINLKASDYNNYYNKEYLSKVYFGFTPSSEIDNYFKFISKYYVPLGSEKSEKLIYDGLALLFGKYYNIYVNEKFVINNYAQIAFYKTILHMIRALIIISVICILLDILKLIIKINRHVIHNRFGRNID